MSLSVLQPLCWLPEEQNYVFVCLGDGTVMQRNQLDTRMACYQVTGTAIGKRKKWFFENPNPKP